MRTACAWSSAYVTFPTISRNGIRWCTRGELVGEYIPDLVVQQKLIVDIKTIDHITDHERGQMLNYLRITTLPVGIILNFKHARLEWERLVLSGERILDGNKEELIL
jgi:GxxExxY protein